MPIYEYQCSECHEKKEMLQKISDPVLTFCNICHKDSLVRLISGAGFQLKGNGWYVTDFKNKPKPVTQDKTPSKPKESKKDD